MDYVALIGAKGFVGTALNKALSKNPKIKVTSITRTNYDQAKKKKFDIIINCAMPSARYWATLNPEKDFEETVLKTADIVYGWKFEKLIQISTISARSELDIVYGRHKAAAEMLCKFGNNLIIRLNAMFDDTLKKGVLIDMLEGRKVFVDKKSSYSFASLDFVSNWIATHLDEKGIIELGSKDFLSLEELAEKLKLDVEFEGKKDLQIVKNPRNEFPKALDVVSFMKRKLKIKKIID